MKKFLTEIKNKLAQNFGRSRVHAVLGNESCDLDSTVCAITYAFYLDKVSKQTDTAFVPVLNIPHPQFRLRTETVHFLNKFGIAADIFVFKDQIDLNTLHKEGRLVLTLVDHNALTGSDVILEDCVTSVFDHHVRQRPVCDKVNVRLEMVGSCATLIAEKLLSDPDFTVDPLLAELLYGTILVDTINKSPQARKTTPLDLKVLDQLSPLIPNVKGDDLFKELEEAKFDLSGLSTREILDRDAKVVSNSSMRVAISSVTLSMEDLLKRTDILADLAWFSEHRTAGVVVVMTIWNDKDHSPHREILIYSESPTYRQQISSCLTNSSGVNLQLKDLECPYKEVTVYHQCFIAGSRKQILPIIQAFLSGK